MCWNGYPPPERDEDDGDAWFEADDEDETGPQEWRGDAHPLNADNWKEAWPGEDDAGPEYWLNKE